MKFLRLKTKHRKNLERLRREHWLWWTLFINLIIILSIIFAVKSAFQFLPPTIPLNYLAPWGEKMLVTKNQIYIPIIAMIMFFGVNFALACKEIIKDNLRITKFYLVTSVAISVILSLYVLRIIDIVSLKTFTVPIEIKLFIVPITAALVTTMIATPLVIKLAHKYNFMDDPLVHKHPGMLITKPTPRAGGLAFYLGVSIPAIFLLPISTSQKLIGIFIGAGICVWVGLKDDQKDTSPYLRLGLQVLAALIVVLSGIILIYVPNPFGNAVLLDNYRIVLDFLGSTHTVYYFSVIAAVIWMMWVMNFMSWANGSDGVYAGLITVTALVMAILMYGNISSDPNLGGFIKLSALIVGAGLGMAYFTWPPQKLLWGFGATAAGLMIAALSILGSTKVSTTLLILMIPFLDGVFAVIRRLRRGQLPFWGDREHFHHKLLEGYGWSKQRVALFYWSSAAMLGVVGLLTSGKSKALSVASVGILVILLISVVANIKFSIKSQAGKK